MNQPQRSQCPRTRCPRRMGVGVWGGMEPGGKEVLSMDRQGAAKKENHKTLGLRRTIPSAQGRMSSPQEVQNNSDISFCFV